ncbi:glycine-rich domain-containing protein [Luteolibacter sp. AS25]|uniref:glycine-rich domain-containing protein n=1 Tax=Luteolibacter sp. AS25 TaxID=3135776 RepID=UPI00398BB8E1
MDGQFLEKILAFELDEDGAQLPFTARLSREQGWTHVYAGRVVEEYKRFIALAMLAGHMVTPSEEVDQAWHLHMVYTKSYWHGLCRDVLGRELHHSPTTGGGDQNAKFHGLYGKTLESYRRIFQAEPPADIWPSVEKRFANAAAGRWVDCSKFWLVPKPAFLSYFK